MYVIKTIRVKKEIWDEFNEMAHRVYKQHGCIKMAIEEALSEWVESKKGVKDDGY